MKRVDAEALMVAMAVAPGVYARNRLFTLFERPDVRRARARASVILGIVRQLSGASGEVEVFRGFHGESGYELGYRIRATHFERRVVLTSLEAACVGYLLSRLTGAPFPAIPEDHDRVAAALRALQGNESLLPLDRMVERDRGRVEE